MEDVLIYDGDCGFCTTATGWLERVLPAFPGAIPYQRADLDALALTREECEERVWFVTERARYGGHLAVAALLRGQPQARWRFWGHLATIPPWSWAAAAAYALVARYRYRLPGGTPACRTPLP